MVLCCIGFFFSSRRRHTRCSRDWSSDVCSSDLSIHEVLEWTVDQALRRFHRQPRLARALWHLQQVGLGYLRLRPPATTLSGGGGPRPENAPGAAPAGGESRARRGRKRGG